MTHEADIVIVGAGLVGLAAAISFAQQGRSVVLVDATKPKPIQLTKNSPWDSRIYALTPATQAWLASLGVWQAMDATRINDISAMHLWHDGAKSPLILADTDANIAKLGLIAESQNLMQALQASVEAASGIVVKNASCKSIKNTAQQICLTLDDDTTIAAKLLVAADGVNSFVRQNLQIAARHKSFNQTAVVANFACEKPHKNIAYQWFGAHETLALLPLVGQNVSLVWSLSTEQARELLLLSETELVAAELAAQVSKRTEYALGDLQALGDAVSFDLAQMTATQLIAERVILLGDAAHQIHPMAGQGVNLGFRDVMAFEKLLAKSHAMQDIGEHSFLRSFERARKADILSMNGLTSGLDMLFASEQKWLNNLTNFGMNQLNAQNFVKKMMIKQAVA